MNVPFSECAIRNVPIPTDRIIAPVIRHMSWKRMVIRAKFQVNSHYSLSTIWSIACGIASLYVELTKFSGGEALLLYSASDRIVEVFLESNHSSVIVDHITHALGVATGGRYIYWTVIRDGNRSIMRAQSDGSEAEEIVTIGKLN